jgi:LysM repeat protein
MKMPSILKRKKLRASAVRRRGALGLPNEIDYEEMSEPNMKLSRALLIVLVLHIVAVAGIIAFNAIKTREAATAGAAESILSPAATTATATAAAAATPATTAESVAAAPNEITRITGKAEMKAPAKTGEPARPVAKTSGVADSGKIYVVVKGDNPVTIARRLHVSYDALLELNQIDDPRKLQIGQKLRLPERTTPSKSKSD